MVQVENNPDGIRLGSAKHLRGLLPEGTHPGLVGMARYFAYDHLPPYLQVVSRDFAELFLKIAAGAQGPETTVAARKLLESKDAAVRAALPDEDEQRAS